MAKAYEILLVPLPSEEGGGFLALVPDLQGCMADGDTQEEALANAKDAIAAWCEAQSESGRKIPEPGAAREQYMQEEAEVIEVLQQQHEIINRLKTRINQLESVRATIQPTYAHALDWHLSAPTGAVISYSKKREIGVL